MENEIAAIVSAGRRGRQAVSAGANLETFNIQHSTPNIQW
jgi:hypothetical protein